MSEDHEYIIKVPERENVPEGGLGYEIFNKMKLRENDIAQYIVETDEAVTIGELLDASKRVAINLKKLELADDAIIAICSWSHKHSCVPYIAGLFNGNIVTFLDPLITPKQKSKMFQKVTPSILFVDEDNIPNIEESLREGKMNIKVVAFEENKTTHTQFKEFLRATDEELASFEPVKLKSNERTAAIIFSSGTTGIPKGICISHLGILARTGELALPTSIILSAPNWISYILPLIRGLREGGIIVMAKKYDLSQIWGLVHKYKIFMILSSPYQCSQIIKEPIGADLDISSLKLWLTGGSCLYPEIHSRMRELVPDVTIIVAYGLTEACGPSLVFDLGNAEERNMYAKKPSSVGRPVSGGWYKVVDPDTEEIMGPNKTGELRIKSRYSMIGFYNEDSSEEFDADGYLRTGDLVYYDEDKCFYIVDRLKEMLKFRSFMWSTTELENVLTMHPAVEIAAVVGLPHVEDGTVPMGIVKLRPSYSVASEELIDYADREIMDDRKKLRAGIKIVKELPLTSSGKVHKKKLRDMILNGEI